MLTFLNSVYVLSSQNQINELFIPYNVVNKISEVLKDTWNLLVRDSVVVVVVMIHEMISLNWTRVRLSRNRILSASV